MILDAVIPPSFGEQTYTWRITPTNDELDDLLTRSNKPRLAIPSLFLAAGQSYRIDLAVEVNDAAAGPASLTVARSDLETMQVTILGATHVETDGTRDVDLSGKAQLPRCESTPIAYHWVQVAGPTVNLPSTFVNRDILHFSPGTLAQGSDYVFELQATSATNPPVSGAATVSVTVLNP